MRAAFFHDERFTLDPAGTYYSSGTLPYRSFQRYLKHFDRVIMVGRLGGAQQSPMCTVASGPGVEFDCIPAGDLALPSFLAAVRRRAREVLARVDCAVIRLPSLVGVLAAREASVAGVPWMAEVVGDVFEALWNHGSWRGKAAALPLYALNRYYVGRASSAIFVSTTLQRRYPPGGAWVAASNVLIEAPRPEVLARRLARIASTAPAAARTIGLVGSYDVAYKGHETALRALAGLRRRGKDVLLRCIGVGDPSRWLRRAAELGVAAHVELGNARPHGEPVLRWMDELDALVVPSLTEGLPRCLVEGMSRALPAVGSLTGGIPELLERPALHRPGDAAGMARRLEALLWSPATLEAQARRNWTLAGDYAAEVLEARRDGLIRRFKAGIAGGSARAA
ncbi:glycosyltransferase [Anaeromyxobacter paludicola]|uniref:Glycosyl transferase group 1 n=1 Tax=Anaeromyxobacter paludicola TaxID=2918171 RepID=A0ABM7X9J7_9BACT|nr:glycosyltransferase [Anaeromyxobacter paludicola]BDG08516.1 hypothetical protein AMPC_16290 [Anaeromyxobacter paludicola]